MISPLELRIGNAVGYKDLNLKFYTVIELKPGTAKIKADDPKGTLIEATYKELQPIVITKAILEKFGFKSDGKSKYTQNGFTLLEGQAYQIADESGKVSLKNNIVSLHRLENIFHDLTGGLLYDKSGSHAKCTCTFNGSQLVVSKTCPITVHRIAAGVSEW